MSFINSAITQAKKDFTPVAIPSETKKITAPNGQDNRELNKIDSLILAWLQCKGNHLIINGYTLPLDKSIKINSKDDLTLEYKQAIAHVKRAINRVTKTHKTDKKNNLYIGSYTLAEITRIQLTYLESLDKVSSKLTDRKGQFRASFNPNKNSNSVNNFLTSISDNRYEQRLNYHHLNKIEIVLNGVLSPVNLTHNQAKDDYKRKNKISLANFSFKPYTFTHEGNRFKLITTRSSLNKCDVNCIVNNFNLGAIGSYELMPIKTSRYILDKDLQTSLQRVHYFDKNKILTHLNNNTLKKDAGRMVYSVEKITATNGDQLIKVIREKDRPNNFLLYRLTEYDYIVNFYPKAINVIIDKLNSISDYEQNIKLKQIKELERKISIKQNIINSVQKELNNIDLNALERHLERANQKQWSVELINYYLNNYGYLHALIEELEIIQDHYTTLDRRKKISKIYLKEINYIMGEIASYEKRLKTRISKLKRDDEKFYQNLMNLIEYLKKPETTELELELIEKDKTEYKKYCNLVNCTNDNNEKINQSLRTLQRKHEVLTTIKKVNISTITAMVDDIQKQLMKKRSQALSIFDLKHQGNITPFSGSVVKRGLSLPEYKKKHKLALKTLDTHKNIRGYRFTTKIVIGNDKVTFSELPTADLLALIEKPLNSEGVNLIYSEEAKLHPHDVAKRLNNYMDQYGYIVSYTPLPSK